MTDNPKTHPTSNAVKDPDDWTTGDEPMTGAQASYLKTLSEQVHQPEIFEEGLTKAEASQRIDEMKKAPEPRRPRFVHPKQNGKAEGNCVESGEPRRKRLGQRRDGKLLLLAQDRANSAQDVPDTRPGQGRRVRLHRALLQSATPPFDYRLSQPDGVRKTGVVSLGWCPPNRQQLNSVAL